jgi:hypothetical protein
MINNNVILDVNTIFQITHYNNGTFLFIYWAVVEWSLLLLRPFTALLYQSWMIDDDDDDDDDCGGK